MAEPTPVPHEADAARVRGLCGSITSAAYRTYKLLISPVLHAVAPSRCMYQPSCSEYAYIAVSRFGILRGSWMAARRLARCHPWATGGLDAVPLQRKLAVSEDRDSGTTDLNR